MLRLGGILNIIIALAHLIGLFWADKMFAITGVSEDMAKLSTIAPSLPYALTIFVAVVFYIFGRYGLNASSKKKELPFLKIVIFSIAIIYMLRGIGEQSYAMYTNTVTTSETIESVIAIGIGLLFLIGGFKKWKVFHKKLN